MVASAGLLKAYVHVLREDEDAPVAGVTRLCSQAAKEAAALSKRRFHPLCREQPAVKINERGTMPLMSRALRLRGSAALPLPPSPASERGSAAALISDSIAVTAGPPSASCSPCIPPVCRAFLAVLPDASNTALPLLSLTADTEQQQVLI